jgi:DNA invertase Pin-like site-specific DNA recombinase
MKNQAVAYYRVSTTRQGESGLGLEAQRETVRRFAASRGMEIVGHFTEVESGKVNDRPELNNAITVAKKNDATLLVAKLDRLSRSALFVLQLIDRADVEFVCCDLPECSRLTLSLFAVLAEHERTLISQRTKAALAAAKARGTKLGSSHPSRDVPRQVRLMVEGYNRDRQSFLNRVRPIIDELKASGVRTLTELALCLTRRAIPTRTGKSVWYGSTVKTVLVG